MANAENLILPQLITKHRDWLVNNWIEQQRIAGPTAGADQAELRDLFHCPLHR